MSKYHVWIAGLVGLLNMGEGLATELEIAPSQGDSMELSWVAEAGFFYGLLGSEDLENRDVPLFFLEGNDESELFEIFTEDAPRFFFQLEFSDDPRSAPATSDYDNDGLLNIEELTDPVSPSDPLDFDSDDDGFSDGGLIDVDGDGIPSAWEIANGYDPEVADPEAVLWLYLATFAVSNDFEVYTELR